jgi:hypothetical protein
MSKDRRVSPESGLSQQLRVAYPVQVSLQGGNPPYAEKVTFKAHTLWSSERMVW